MAEFYGNSVGAGTVAHTLPPVVEHHSVQRPLQARGFQPEAVVGGENGYCTSFAAINGVVPGQHKRCGIVGNDFEIVTRKVLAQLHQLRGRVGRGDSQSYCIFIHGKDQAEHSRRLQILNKSNDGFYIAAEDLKLRGPGDLFGVRQSGVLELGIADIFRDADIMKMASETAGQILELDFELALPQHRGLKERLEQYCSRQLDDIGL